MGYKSICTVLGAQNATETQKTLIDTVTVPQGVKSLVGLGINVSANGLTTLESISGIVEVESDNMSPWGGTQTFLFGMQNALTSGSVAANPVMHPCNIVVTPGATLKLSATYDRALTINPSTRCQLVFE